MKKWTLWLFFLCFVACYIVLRLINFFYLKCLIICNSLILVVGDQICFQNNSYYLLNTHHGPDTALTTLYTLISFNF